MKRLLRTLVCLSLVFSLLAPAFALEGEQGTPPAIQEQDYVDSSCQDGYYDEVPVWQEWGYDTLAEFVVYEGISLDDPWVEDLLTPQERQDQTFLEEYLHVRGMFIGLYAEKHAEWFANLDYDRLFQTTDHYYNYHTPEAYRQAQGMTPEQHREEMQYQWALKRRGYEGLAREIAAYAQEHPEAYAAFDPEEFLQVHYSWLESLDAHAESLYILPDEAALIMAENWMYRELSYDWMRAEWEEFYAEHPHEAEAFDAVAYFYESYHAEWYGSPEEYRRERGLTQEQFFLELALEWVSGRSYRYDYAQEIRDTKLALGGNPDGVDVMVNGTFVSFPDVRPEIHNGRIMAPMNHILTCMGAELTYLETEHAVSVVLSDDSTLFHEVGSTAITHTPAGGGEGQTVQMDAPSYVKDARAMIPVSFFADVMGYTVGWDSDYQTAVLVDKAIFARHIDQSCSLMGRVWNQVVRWQPEKEGNALMVDGTFRGAVTMPGEDRQINRYSFGVSTTLLETESGLDFKLDSDLSDLLRLYRDQMVGYGMSEEYLAEGLQEIKELVSRVKLEMIANYDSGVAYLRSGLVDYVMGRPASAWYSLPFEDNLPLDLGSIRALRGMSLGEFVTELAFAGSPTVEGWWDATEVLDGTRILADDQFQRNNGVYTFTYSDSYGGDYYSSDESITLRITPEGEGCSFEIAYRQDSSYGDLTDQSVFQLTCKGDTLTFLLEYEDGDTGFTLTGDITWGETTKLPRKAPPPGLEIVPLDDWYGY